MTKARIARVGGGEWLKNPRSEARLWNIDRLLMVWLYRLYPSLLATIIVVQPETMICWHRRGFRAYWHWKSRHVGDRPRIDSEIRALIRRMRRANPLWRAPRIHGELLMLGIEVAESTVSRYMARRRRAPSHPIRDRDRAFGLSYTHRIRAMGIRDHPIAPRSPRQNGYVERLIGSIRRESLDHMIVFDEAQLRRVLKDSYYNHPRTESLKMSR